jgi:hypothetical protein
LINLNEKYGTTEGLAKLRAGQEAYEEVAHACSSPDGPTEEDHKKLRDALATLRSAMNWLEDTNYFETAHEALDRAGSLARAAFPHGCVLPYRDSSYYMECPVALAHNRVGMSIGFVAQAVECSICGRDPDECPHITGRLYDGERCVREITQGDLLDVSLVARPEQPDARIMRMSVDMSDLRESLGEEFVPGSPVTCDRCLSPCDGVARPFEELYEHYTKVE